MNVRGFRDPKKRAILFRQCKTLGYDIIGLQDTHLTIEDTEVIEQEWGGHFHLVPGTRRKNGLLTLYRKEIPKEKVSIVMSRKRCLISKISHFDKTFYCFNIYSPCIDEEKIPFLNTLKGYFSSELGEDISSCNILCFGDFNIVRNNELDIVSGKPHPDQIVNHFNDVCNDLLLFDFWREKHPITKDYTWSSYSRSTFIARRLDYILVSNELLPFCLDPKIINMGFSDHRAVSLSLNLASFPRGPSIYKFNVNTLKNENFVKNVKEEIERIKNLELNPHDTWEYIKIQIAALGKLYGRSIALEKRNKKELLQLELDECTAKLISDPTNVTLKNQRIKIQQNLEVHLLSETEGARIRAKQKWIEDGEKCSKFFMGLEKQRGNSNTIFKLDSNNSENVITQPLEIIETLRSHFENVYKILEEDNNTNEDVKRLFLSNNESFILSDFSNVSLDRDVTEDEILAALKDSDNGASPGMDGLPCEVYKFFWHDIKASLLNSIRFSYENGILCYSQTCGMITLLHKGNDLKREVISNWRPITLTNADYKLIAKILAKRLSVCIDDLISKNQFAFIKGRNIADMLREINDIIEYGKSRKSNHLVVSLDYAKAFDTISLASIMHALNFFGFGANFQKWIKIILTDRRSCVTNGGYLSDFFDMQRGVRQGCPLAPLLFILTVELLAINIRKDDKIHGINIDGYDSAIKIRQYADDATLFLRDIIDFREVLSKIKLFSIFTGLKLNKNKSFTLVLGNTERENTLLCGIKCVNKIKILGIYFSNLQHSSELKENFETRIDRLMNLCGLWSKRKLSLSGKIVIIKSFGLSIFIYLMKSIGISDDYLNRINRIIFGFLWKDKMDDSKATERVARKTICNSFENGGLKMCCAKEMQDSFLFEWGEKLLSKTYENWKVIPRILYSPIGGTAVFDSYIEIKKFKGLDMVNDLFWRRVLKNWIEKKTQLNTYFNHEFVCLSSVIFNNMYIKFKNKSLFFPQCLKSGIIRVLDFCGNDGFLSLNDFKEKYKNNADAQLVYNVIYNALRPHENYIKGRLLGAHEHTCHIQSFSSMSSEAFGRKKFLSMLHDTSTPLCVDKWCRNFDFEFDKDIWLIPRRSTKDIKLITLQWKILHRIYATGILLEKMKIKTTNKCPYCQELDTLEHYFFHCESVKTLWNAVGYKIQNLFENIGHFKIDCKMAMLGLLNHDKLPKSSVTRINIIILIAKQSISTFKKVKKSPLDYIFESELKIRKVNI